MPDNDNNNDDGDGDGNEDGDEDDCNLYHCIDIFTTNSTNILNLLISISRSGTSITSTRID